MVAPAVAPISEEIYSALGPLTVPDEANGWVLLLFVDANAQGLVEVEDLARDQPDGTPGWASILDVDLAPTDALGWLGQFVGVDLVAGLDDASQRLRIQEAAGWSRGSVAAIKAAAAQYLTGTRRVQVFERDGSPYRFRLRTWLAETPDPAAVQAAIQSLKPAGLVFTYEVQEGLAWDEVAGTWDSQGALTWDDYSVLVPGP